MISHPRVGIGVIVLKENKVLVGKRKSKHGEGVWGFPGGKLDYGEDIFACAQRETLEEANITLKHLRVAPYTNDIFPDEHYVTLFVVGEYATGDVKTMEPDKCEGWEWHDWDTLPEPVFLPITHLKEQGFTPII